MSGEARLLVRQFKGEAGRPWTQRLVLKGLGLRGPGSQVVVSNERAIRGMIRKVLHLVVVEEVAAGDGAAAKAAPGKVAAKAAPAKATPTKAVAAKASAKAAPAKKGKS
jgi:large subunit ribosomal protein L30